jgi:hypothetical protein
LAESRAEMRFESESQFEELPEGSTCDEQSEDETEGK